MFLVGEGVGGGGGGGGGTGWFLPKNKPMGMPHWMGPHLVDWIDYNEG